MPSDYPDGGSVHERYCLAGTLRSVSKHPCRLACLERARRFDVLSRQVLTIWNYQIAFVATECLFEVLEILLE
jgi:hypothetical protein